MFDERFLIREVQMRRLPKAETYFGKIWKLKKDFQRFWTGEKTSDMVTGTLT